MGDTIDKKNDMQILGNVGLPRKHALHNFEDMRNASATGRATEIWFTGCFEPGKRWGVIIIVS